MDNLPCLRLVLQVRRRACLYFFTRIDGILDVSFLRNDYSQGRKARLRRQRRPGAHRPSPGEISEMKTTTTSVANTGNQVWTQCPMCGVFYQEGETHVCSVSGTFTLPSGTAKEYWTCSACGARVPYGELHVCGGRGDSGTWPPANPPNSTWPPQPEWPKSTITVSSLSLEERRVRALERIANALEKLAK